MFTVSAAPASRHSSQHWQEVLASLPATVEHPPASVPEGKAEAAVAGEKLNNTSSALNKRSSKRSLLTDISSLASNEIASNGKSTNKKRKTDTATTSTMRNKKIPANKKALPSNQKSIMSYFKSS